MNGQELGVIIQKNIGIIKKFSVPTVLMMEHFGCRLMTSLNFFKAFMLL